MGKIEDIILRYSNRGMPLLLDGVPADFCSAAADEILRWERGTVLIVTGFFVAGYAETDGPPGAIVIANALRQLGFLPVIVTDDGCRNCFEAEGLRTVYLPLNADTEACKALLDLENPVGLISIERCGHTADGHYKNMRAMQIDAYTAPCDRLFELTGLPSVGIGDGGNEIGMGTIADLIRERLPIDPCVVPVDKLILATVSNWGGYGLTAALSHRSGKDLLPPYAEIAAILERMCALGYVDGIYHTPAPTEDGFGPAVTAEIVNALHSTI